MGSRTEKDWIAERRYSKEAAEARDVEEEVAKTPGAFDHPVKILRSRFSHQEFSYRYSSTDKKMAEDERVVFARGKRLCRIRLVRFETSLQKAFGEGLVSVSI